MRYPAICFTTRTNAVGSKTSVAVASRAANRTLFDRVGSTPKPPTGVQPGLPKKEPNLLPPPKASRAPLLVYHTWVGARLGVAPPTVQLASLCRGRAPTFDSGEPMENGKKERVDCDSPERQFRVRFLVRETGISEAEAHDLIDRVGYEVASLLREARYIKGH